MARITGATIAKRVLPMFYLTDGSVSMDDNGKITVLNRAMRECISDLRSKAKSNPDADIRIGAIKFSSGAKWITSEDHLVSVENFEWNDIETDSVTDLGAALLELEKKLSRDGLLKSDTGFFLPVIIIMSDGYPTDEYEKALAKANENKWFRRARKIAIAIGDDADRDVLAKVVGNREAVLKPESLEALSDAIREVSVSSSMLASVTRTNTGDATGSDIVADALKRVAKGKVTVEKNTDNNAGSNIQPKDDTRWESDDDDDDEWK